MVPPLVSRILFRSIIFNCYNICICKKEKPRDETSKKILETNGGQIKEQDVPIDLRFPTGMLQKKTRSVPKKMPLERRSDARH